MSDPTHEAISVFCDEVGVPAPQPDAGGLYQIEVDGQQVRVFTLRNGKVVLLGVIGAADALAENRRESRETLLSGCLTLQAVRFGKLGTQEVLTLEPETGELILWRSFDGTAISISSFLAAAESLLNEVEFWKNWLAAT